MTIIKTILGAALIGALFLSGWRIYRRLPNDPSNSVNAVGIGANANSELAIVLNHEIAAASSEAVINLYPIDFAAAQRDFSANLRPGKTFDDFLAQRMKGLTPLRTQVDSQGSVAVKLSGGNWWIHATASLLTGERLEWRLPVSIAGNKQTIELTLDNAYERTKKF